MLIVLEGIDNAGKTTQANEICSWLMKNGYRSIITHELQTDIGQLTRKYFERNSFSPILKTLLFAADRYERLDGEIIPALKEGKIVIADRYIYSAIAYRSAEMLDVQWVEKINKFAPKPDISIFIDISPEESIRRAANDKHTYYGMNFLAKVRKEYLKLVEKDDLIKINGMTDKSTVCRNIINKIKPLLNEGDNSGFTN
jgi:dTMP kinase